MLYMCLIKSRCHCYLLPAHSTFPASFFRYRDFINSPKSSDWDNDQPSTHYIHTKDYWHVLTAKLAFILVFEVSLCVFSYNLSALCHYMRLTWESNPKLDAAALENSNPVACCNAYSALYAMKVLIGQQDSFGNHV